MQFEFRNKISMYFKISLQIKSRILNRTSDYLSLTQPEFQCVYTIIKQ